MILRRVTTLRYFSIYLPVPSFDVITLALPHHSSVLLPNPWQAEGPTRLHTLRSKSDGNKHVPELLGHHPSKHCQPVRLVTHESVLYIEKFQGCTKKADSVVAL